MTAGTVFDGRRMPLDGVVQVHGMSDVRLTEGPGLGGGPGAVDGWAVDAAWGGAVVWAAGRTESINAR